MTSGFDPERSLSNILGHLYRIEHAQPVKSPIVTAIVFDLERVTLHLAGGATETVDPDVSEADLLIVLEQATPGLLPAKGGVLPMLTGGSVEENWIELHYDLAVWEKETPLRYRSVRLRGEAAIVMVDGPHGTVQFTQSLAYDVQPVGVPFDIVDAYTAASN